MKFNVLLFILQFIPLLTFAQANHGATKWTVTREYLVGGALVEDFDADKNLYARDGNVYYTRSGEEVLVISNFPYLKDSPEAELHYEYQTTGTYPYALFYYKSLTDYCLANATTAADGTITHKFDYWNRGEQTMQLTLRDGKLLAPEVVPGIPYIIMDFSMTTGDRLVSNNGQGFVEPSSCYVSADETIEVRGRQFRRLTIRTQADDRLVDYWVEGIGSRDCHTQQIISISIDQEAEFKAPRSERLTAVYAGNELIFTYDDFATTNVVTGVNSTATSTACPQTFYNLQGQRVGADYRGIVIRDGKKYLQR